MLDTDQLRSFVAIVDTGSFTRAAERVNKTQSAVSMQIAGSRSSSAARSSSSRAAACA